MPSAGITSVLSLTEAEIPLENTEKLLDVEVQFWGWSWAEVRAGFAVRAHCPALGCCGRLASILPGLPFFKKRSPSGAGPSLRSGSAGLKGITPPSLFTKGKLHLCSAKGQGGFQANASSPPPRVGMIWGMFQHCCLLPQKEETCSSTAGFYYRQRHSSRRRLPAERGRSCSERFFSLIPVPTFTAQH